MKVIFLGYRPWALKSFNFIKNHQKIESFRIIKSNDELSKINLKEWDLLITLGWSDELGEKIASDILAIGLHCAELDRYSYGTPIQLQIIDGITMTKHRIFPFKYLKDSERAHTHTREFSHEVDLSLLGGIDNIFGELTSTSNELLTQFLDDFPHIEWKLWPEENIKRKKRTPRDSKLSKKDLISLSARELYNFIRCLEDPYPNAYIEDETGRMLLKKVTLNKE